MSRLAPFDPAVADGRRKELLDAVQASFGATPNLFRTAAQSETALAAMLEMFQTINGGTLGPQLVEKIAIAVAEVNGCSYCLSAHTAIGKMHGVPAEELESSRGGVSSDAKTEAALRFARTEGIIPAPEPAHLTAASTGVYPSEGYSPGVDRNITRYVCLTAGPTG